MSLKIEEGSEYVSRNGDIEGPFTRLSSPRGGRFWWVDKRDHAWADDGRFDIDNLDDPRDLISVHRRGPVITRTVTEIVPGLYDHVKVNDPLQEPAKDGCAHVSMYGSLSADGLRAAARILVSLAEALEENAK